jgi:Fe-S-cluster containining protein
MICRQDFFARARSMSSGYTTEQLYAAYEAFLTCPRSPFRDEREAYAVDCGRCGNCCRRSWRVEVSLRDVLRWAAEGRRDILSTLEYQPLGPDPVVTGNSPAIKELARLLANEDEDCRTRILAMARSLESDEGCYVLPKKDGCFYLIDGDTAACNIYDTRPEVCRLFPGVK